jgi:hypothetical protein
MPQEAEVPQNHIPTVMDKRILILPCRNQTARIWANMGRRPVLISTSSGGTIMSTVYRTLLLRVRSCVWFNKCRVAVGYEDRPGSVASYQRRLFAKMRPVRGNYWEESRPAVSSLVMKPVNPAFSGAYRAGLKKSIRLLDPVRQFAGFSTSDIGWIIISLHCINPAQSSTPVMFFPPLHLSDRGLLDNFTVQGSDEPY